MPIETDLSVAPYFNDFNEDKKFHGILFKPDVAVQTREINQLQTILQNQIERFGNNVFKRGTIIDGCNFIFYDRYPYIKINDVTLGGLVAVPANYVGFFVKNDDNLKAYVINSGDGFESTNPNLKTLYLKYINSGDSEEDVEFAAGQILTVYDANNSVHEIPIQASGSGYSNSDVIVITPVILANVVSGSFGVGDSMSDPISGSSGVIISVEDETVREASSVLAGTVAVTSASPDVNGTGTAFTSHFTNGDYVAIYSNSTSYVTKHINVVGNSSFMNLTTTMSFTDGAAAYANTTDSRVFIKYRAQPGDLANTAATSNDWSFAVGNTVVGTTNTDILDVIDVLGENAAGVFVTDFAGRIISTTVTNRGTGYVQPPHVSIKTATGSSANLTAQNYYAQVTISSLAATVGEGYAFGITDGIIYQKGYFIKADAQTIIVDKYSRSPDGVAVGFYTEEEVIDANQDTSLFDNVTGFNNLNAPGADRLKLTPTLVSNSVANVASNTEFFSIVEWSAGVPYKQNQRTFFNSINDELAQRTDDVNGSFVVDRFIVTTASPANIALSANTVAIVVDPGTAYIEGHRVQTFGNFVADSPKAVTTKVEDHARVSLNYENYVKVNNVGGMFEFDRANLVSIYDTATGYLANTVAVTTGNTAPLGSKIGEARIRNFTYEQGTPGSPNAVYRLYLFNIRMETGRNFADARTIWQDGTNFDGIADVAIEPDASTGANVAILHGKNNALLFSAGFTAPLNSNGIIYSYRTIDDALEIANTGIVTISLASQPGKTFTYAGDLSDAQKNELYLAPAANLLSFANLTGTVNVTSTSPNILGVGTDFVAQVRAGQYINVNGGVSNNVIRRIVSVTNAIHMVASSNLGFTDTAMPVKWAWPKNVPIQLAYNPSYTANISGANNEILNINLGHTLSGSSNVDIIVAYNVEVTDPTPTAKVPERNQLVKLRLANNAAGLDGPWCLGVPDIFRLRSVYIGNSSVSSASSSVTDEFFIDHNQTSNYYDLGYLYQKNKSSLILTDDDYLLVEYDAFTVASPGFYTVTSYVSGTKATRFTEDSRPLEDLTDTVNTFEIPETFDDKGRYYDLINQIDFRPIADPTANVTANTAAVTTNPANTLTFSNSDKFFPVPDSLYRHDVEYFVPRIDAIVLDKNRTIKVINGTSATNPPVPQIPSGSMKLNNVYIPEYPSLPESASAELIDIVVTNVYSNKYNGTRVKNKKISQLFSSLDLALEQPKNYTQLDIGQIDRRLQDVERYAILNFMQSAIKDRAIPSSISPNIDRFKYGFFVDDYVDDVFSEVESPEYAATVMENYAWPLLDYFNVVHVGAVSSSPWTDQKILSQNFATTAPVVVNPPPPPPPTPDYDGTIKITPSFFKSQMFTVRINESQASHGNPTGAWTVTSRHVIAPVDV